MKILLVSPAAELGGAERCLLDFVVALRESRDVQVELVALADGPLLKKARDLGARVQVVEAPRELSELGESGRRSESGKTLADLAVAAPSTVRFLARLQRAIAAQRPDVVHTNGMKAHLLAGLLTLSRARLVIHLHDFIGARRASKWLLPVLSRVRRRAVFIANSRAVAEDFQRIAPSAEVRTIYNVVDTDYFHDGLDEPEWLGALAELGPPRPETIHFGLVATYARWKGHGLFIEAAGLLKKARPQAALRFYVVGGPIYKTHGSQVRAAELVEQARAVGVESCFGLVP
ncbi:MAG TPA: glycosyltransferase, partial [Polyangiaceae bacterium]